VDAPIEELDVVPVPALGRAMAHVDDLGEAALHHALEGALEGPDRSGSEAPPRNGLPGA
jgi:hypothetical protein